MFKKSTQNRFGFARTLVIACLLAVMFTSLSIQPALGQVGTIHYVTPTGTGDCSSWENACGLQTALAQAQPGSEIWVAVGTYKPTTGTDRNVSFVLKEGVAIYGGFAGTETERSQRDWAANLTILSGDIGVLGNPSDNSLHVIRGANLTDSAVLDGVTITGGMANLTGNDGDGGGMHLTASSPAFENLTFTYNAAIRNGGAVHSGEGSPSFRNCVFNDNVSQNYGGAVYSSGRGLIIEGGEALRNTAALHGGALFASYSPFGVRISDFHFAENQAKIGGAVSLSGAEAQLTGLSFHANSAQSQGGALYTTGENVRIDRATFTENTSALRGGAIYDSEAFLSSDGAVITNSLFYKNSSANMGGAVYTLYQYDSPTRIINTTFYGNSSVVGGAVASSTHCAVIRNSILWGNTASFVSPQVHAAGCTANIENSIVQGWSTDLFKKIYGSTTPQFMSIQAGSLDLRLRPASPGVNNGSDAALPPDTLVDLDGNPRFAGDTVDMGAYEQQTPNHSPELTQSVVEMPAILEDDGLDQGILVADLIGSAAFDADGSVPGIAMLSIDKKHGVWGYQPENSTYWIQFSSPCAPCRGQVVGPNARIRFLPNTNWNGTVTGGLTFRLWDMADGLQTGDWVSLIDIDFPNGSLSKETGSLSITVNPVNDPPANAGSPPYLTGAPVPGQPLSVIHGPWNDSSDSPDSVITIAYRWQVRAGPQEPWEDIPGAASQSYTVAEGDLGKEISALVTVTDDGVGQPPSASSEARSAILAVVANAEVIQEGETALVAMDEDSSPLPFVLALRPLNNLAPEWQIAAAPGHGTATVSSAGVVTYKPAANYHGADTFTVQAVVGILVDSITVDVTIRPRNDAPVVVIPPALVGPARYGHAVNADPGEWNDSLDLHPGQLAFTYSWQSAPAANGTFTSIPEANGLAYTPQSAEVGRYLRFVVRASDSGEGLPASMISEVYSVASLVTNTAPVIDEGSGLDVTGSPVRLHAADADGNPLTWLIGAPPSHGTATVDASGLVRYSLRPNCTGMDEFSVIVTDGAASDSIFLRPPAGTCRYYVDDTASGANNGIGWHDAYTDLQTALAVAIAGDEIWVAAGTYYPTQLTDRAATFQLKEGLAVYGGFRGDEASLSERDWKAAPTILSGDIGTRVVTTDNSYHVVSTSRLTAASVLDGFVITGGNANGISSPVTNSGGGLMNYPSSSPTLRNLRFENCYGEYGGGMSNVDASSPTLENVEFSGNKAYRGGGLYNTRSSSPILTHVLFMQNTAYGYGGGMSSTSSSGPRLARVTFQGNVTEGNHGGGLENDTGSLILTDVVFLDNSAGESAGAVRLWGANAVMVNVKFVGNAAKGNVTMGNGGAGLFSNKSTAVLVNTLFYGNSADSNGSAIFNENSTLTVVNSTFSRNQAASSGVITSPVGSTTVVRNSILWENQTNLVPGTFSTTFQYSIVQGLANDPAKGVYGDEAHNPRFASPDFGDFRLLGDSAAINGGLNSLLPADTADLDADGDTAEPLPLDLDRAARVLGGVVDLGAYEFQDMTALVAVNDNIPAFDEDSIQELDVLANDNPPPGGEMTITAVTQGSKGSVSIKNNRVRYEPNKDTNGTDSFTYTVTYGESLTDTAAVYITILPVNDAPYLDEFADIEIYMGSIYEAVLTVNDVETLPDDLLVSVKSSNKTLVPVANITVTGSGNARTLTITPMPGQTGVTTITITVTDGDGGTSSASFTLTVETRKLYLPMTTQ